MSPQVPEKYIEAIKNMDDKTRYYIFGGILFVVFLLDYFLLMKPQIDSLNKINPEVSLLVEDIQKIESDILRLPNYQKKVAKLVKEVEAVDLKLRVKEEAPLLMERISRFALDNNIHVTQMIPLPDQMEVVLENKQRKYFSMPIQVEALGSYHDIGRFLNTIEVKDISLHVVNCTISSGVKEKKHSVKMTINAIVFEENKGK